MKSNKSRIIVFTVLCIAALIATGTAMAQESQPACPPTDPPTGCAVVALSPTTLTGDFYIGEQLLGAAQPQAALVVPPSQSQVVTIRSIQSTEVGFGQVFVYKDATQSVFVAAGQTRSYTVRPQKQFIRGTLEYKCDIRNTVAGDSVFCQVSIDGVVQPENVVPTAKVKYILDPGTHVVTTTLVGEHAAIWTPASMEQKTQISAGGTRSLTATFNKQALLTLTIDQPNVLVDFYVDGQLVAAQVPSHQLYVTPSKYHKVEARNATDPTANGVYRWKDASLPVYLSPAQVKTVQLHLQKQYLKGFLKITCKVSNPPANEQLFCQPAIDGIFVEQIPVGGSMTYTVDPGSRQVVIALVPQGNWIAQPKTIKPYVAAGQTSNQTVIFSVQLPPTPTPVPLPPTSVPTTGNVQITYVFYNGAVPRVESDEYAVVKNFGSGAVNLAGWHLNAGDAGQDFWFPNFVLQPGGQCHIYTNEYHPDSCGFSFGIGKAIWNNDGDCGHLYDPAGTLIDSYCY